MGRIIKSILYTHVLHRIFFAKLPICNRVPVKSQLDMDNFFRQVTIPTWFNLKINAPHYVYKPTSKLIPASVPSKLNQSYTQHFECPNSLIPPADQVCLTFSLNIHIIYISMTAHGPLAVELERSSLRNSFRRIPHSNGRERLGAIKGGLRNSIVEEPFSLISKGTKP